MSGGVCPPCLSYSLLKSATLSEELWDKSQSRHQPIDQNERVFVCIYVCVLLPQVDDNTSQGKRHVLQRDCGRGKPPLENSVRSYFTTRSPC